MNFYTLTSFPDMVMGEFGTSITGWAMSSGAIPVEAIDIGVYPRDKHRHVDDAPYGGGTGTVVQLGPVCKAYEDLCARTGKKPGVLYITFQGRALSQSIAEGLAKKEDLVFLYDHYEGIDERTPELIVADYLSVRDFVLTDGEFPAMVVIDYISRPVPSVLDNEVPAEEKSFRDNLLEHPQYAKPEVLQGMAVPEALLGGHHRNVEGWRRQQSVKRTLERRPDLLAGVRLTLKEHKHLDSLGQGEGGIGQLGEILESYVESVGSGEVVPRIKHRAIAVAKKLLASGECTLEDVENFYKVCSLEVKWLKHK